MNNTHKFPPECPPDRFWLIHGSIVRYCDRMWANIASFRKRAMEHIVIMASMLGFYLGFDAGSSYYSIGWWGSAGILCLLCFTLPHLQITTSVTKTDENRLGPEHATRPKGEPEGQVLSDLDDVANKLGEEMVKIGKRYYFARNYFRAVGVPLAIVLSVLEWFL